MTLPALHRASVNSAIRKSAKAETFAGRARGTQQKWPSALPQVQALACKLLYVCQ